MAAELREIFDRIKKTKKERKEIKNIYADALRNSKAYQEVLEELKKLKDKKLRIESTIKAEFVKEFEKMDNYKKDIDTDNQLLSDLAFNGLIKGETVQIEEENGTKYDPVFSVKFKKSEDR